MRLVQNFALINDYKITTWLSEECFSEKKEFLMLTDTCELSFYPFRLRTWAHREYIVKQEICAQLDFTWQIVISDDEEEKPLFSIKSENRSLLLLAELLEGFFETCQKAGFLVASIRPDLESFSLNFSLKISPGADLARILGGALILRAATDSLLFCRGLKIKSSSFFIGKNNEAHPHLKAIFLGNL